MNPIKKALSEVQYRIPKQLLEAVFVNGASSWRGVKTLTLEDQILSLVVRPRVMVDCNLVGGTEAMIDLSGLAQEQPETWMTVIHVPKNRTGGRSINSVLSVCLYNTNVVAGYASVGVAGAGNVGVSSNGYTSQDGSAMTSALSGAVGALDKAPLVATSRVSLIAENTILIRDGLLLPPNAYLRCILANDENMSHLQLRSYSYFAKLVEYAVKAYIYNELIITVDEAQLRYGQAVGAFKDIFSSYADAEQNYQDYLKQTWEKVAMMNDPEAYYRYLRLHISGNR